MILSLNKREKDSIESETLNPRNMTLLGETFPSDIEVYRSCKRRKARRSGGTIIKRVPGARKFERRSAALFWDSQQDTPSIVHEENNN